ncbi:Na+/H+ antiporter subunit E [Kineococcus rhizosphaerae]|uniref:Multisubunit sodium/proton antiporter MrpE subunit n=1 Tax=Kineococcus rhizosphaerae TaxID=559628 RepID=A0A2T0QYD3_9ACTN|nr:Na+/H+ antiporter subunit E [Kineococcus rhizosphaerae]PRY11392.1 multisubunit sodium/proton antiporter MrpE subunit [Kineococcus rhizosphaerae]
MNAKVLSLRERVSVPLLVWLVVLWLLLWGDLSWANVISGTVLALLVTLVLPMPTVSLGIRIRPLRIVALLARFAADLFAASAQVAWLTVRPGRQPRNSVVKVPLHSGSDLFVTMTAEMVSLVPGSVIVELGAPSLQGGQGSIYVHALGVDTEEGRQRIRREVLLTERRILKTFATPQVYAEYLDRCRADGSDSLCEGSPA